MKHEDVYVVADSVVARDLGDEIVLLDLAGGVYFGLNEVGAKVWSGLERNLPMNEICTSLIDEYSVERSVIEADVDELIKKLLEKELITVSKS